MEMTEIKLPSGATLKVAPAPFADSKALYQAILSEVKSIALSSNMELSALMKDLFCTGFSSKVIEAAFDKCAARCLYNGKKISNDTFEPIEAREDFTKVYVEVARVNVAPFLKSLYVEYKTGLAMAESIQA